MSSKTNYTQGYSQATQATHASRTVDSDASFLVPHIRPTDHILDVGCGPGTITVGFAGLISSQGSVTGVDISETVLEKAKQAVASSSIVTEGKQVTFLQADLLSHDGLPLKDATFDVVFTSQLFPHLSTHDMRIQALAEMRRVLKPGGILATRDAAHLHFYPQPPAVPARYDLNQLWAGNMLRPLGTRHLPGGDMPCLFYQVGFNVDKVKSGREQQRTRTRRPEGGSPKLPRHGWNGARLLGRAGLKSALQIRKLRIRKRHGYMGGSGRGVVCCCPG
ncbi:S-adenosyl-L-methionine-dependent methyltransferase [Rhypophila decipiens]